MGHDDLEQQLDALLAQRTVPEMRSNLAFRIIETSRTVQQERSGFAGLSEKIKSVRCSFLKVIEAVLDCIALPRPAFAILTVVIMAAGIVFGSYTGKTWSVSSLNSGFSLAGLENSRAYDSSDVETFVMVTDSFEYGDFL